MRAAVGISIALLGWFSPHFCIGWIRPGHLKGPPKVHPASERPLELGAPDTAIPNSPPTPTTKVVPSSSYFMTIPTSETKESLSTVPKPTITTPPHVLDKRWETVLSGPLVLDGTTTITDPASILTCLWTGSMSSTWEGTTFTPGYTMVVPNYDDPLFGIFTRPPQRLLSGFMEVTTTPSTWTEPASSAAPPKTNTSITTSTSQEIYGYGGGYGGGLGQRHRERAEAATVPNTSGFTSIMTATISGRPTPHSTLHISIATPEPYGPHDKRWMTTITEGAGLFTRTYSKSIPISFTTDCVEIWNTLLSTTMSACLALPAPFSDQPSKSDADHDLSLLNELNDLAIITLEPNYEQLPKRWTTVTVTDLDGKHTLTDLTSTPTSSNNRIASILSDLGSILAKQRRKQQQHQHSASTATATVISTVIIKRDKDPKIARAPTGAMTTSAAPTLVLGPSGNLETVPQTCRTTTLM